MDDGALSSPVATIVAHSAATRPMHFSLNAATKVAFYGDRYFIYLFYFKVRGAKFCKEFVKKFLLFFFLLSKPKLIIFVRFLHGYVSHQFSGYSGTELSLYARARQFSRYFLNAFYFNIILYF